MKKYIFTFMFSFFVLFSNVNALELDIKSENILVYNLNDNIILYEKNSNKNVSIASLTKIVTVLVAIENIDNINERVILTSPVFENLFELDASVAGFKLGESVSYEDLLYGAMLPSGADATRALAINLFGNEENFVKKMNELMKKINVNNTIFTNTSGLDEIGQSSTLNDLLKVFLYAIKNETFINIFNSRSYNASNGLTLKSTLDFYQNRHGIDTSIITGGKTGYTDNAGLALLSYVKNDDIQLLVISTNAPVEETKYPYHITDAINIYDYYLDNYKYINILKKDTVVTSVKSKFTKNKNANLIYKNNFNYFLSKEFDRKDLDFNYDLPEHINLFTNINNPVGSFTINYNGENILKGDLFLQEKPAIDFKNLIIYGTILLSSSIFSILFIKKGR